MHQYHSLFLGAGRLAQFFFQQQAPDGWGIVSRTPGPLTNICGDLMVLPLHTWPPVKQIIIALSPNNSSPQAYAHLYLNLLPRILSQLQYQRIVLISSTRVYAAEEQAWITENSPLSTTDSAALFLQAGERAVQHWSFNSFAIIRASGLYDTIQPPPDSWVHNDRWANRLHYEDLARLVAFTLELNSPLQLIINGSDNAPFIPQKAAPLFTELRSSPNSTSTRPARSLKISNLLSRSLGFQYRHTSVINAYKEKTLFIKQS